MLLAGGEIVATFAASESFIVLTIFFLINSKPVAKALSGEQGKAFAVMLLGLIGGLFGMFGTAMSASVEGVTLGVRDIGPILAGIFGGPGAGIISGAITGLHRYTIGGTTQVISSIATFLVGTISGLLSTELREKIRIPKNGHTYGFAIEAFHLSLLLIFVKPFSLAFTIVKAIVVPFTVLNAVGFAACLFMLSKIEEKNKLVLEKERIRTELELAHNIQASMLPRDFPDNEHYELYATMTPAKDVGGDFYDFFNVDDRHIAIVIADVSGKGIPAALFMVTGMTLIRNYTGIYKDPGEVLTVVNRRLNENNDKEFFITAFEGILDLETGIMKYANAGHERPYIRRTNGDYASIKPKKGRALALFPDMVYESDTITLNEGDRFFHYTDGLSEATNGSGERLGMKSLDIILNSLKELSPKELLPAIKDKIDAYVGDNEPFDDLTMEAIFFKKKCENTQSSVETE